MYLFHLKEIVGVEKFFIQHKDKPYKYSGQDKLIRDFQIYTAYNCINGKTKIKISKKTFDEMIPKNNQHLYKNETFITIFGIDAVIENLDYDGYYIYTEQ